MYNIIPLILILLSLLGIIIIVARKFSILANLDVDSIPEEKEAKFKQQIAGDRLKRNIVKWTSRGARFFEGLYTKASGFLKGSYDRLNKIKKDYDREVLVQNENKQAEIRRLFEEVEDLDERENFEEMEQKLIEIVGLDSKQIDAFEKLGDLYFENKKYDEARETYNHILKLINGEDAGREADIFFDIALIDKEKGNYQDAFKSIKKALSLTPNNPRYLDIMFEISIIIKDKNSALEAYKKLAETNPDNAKLPQLKEQLNKLS